MAFVLKITLYILETSNLTFFIWLGFSCEICYMKISCAPAPRHVDFGFGKKDTELEMQLSLPFHLHMFLFFNVMAGALPFN